ncbi:hypothetical protein KR054_002331, partial [Drosophila jambulina]
MSRSLTRVLGPFGPSGTWMPMAALRGFLLPDVTSALPMAAAQRANYAKRNGPPWDAEQPFKTVSKSRRRVDDYDDDELISLESEPNWELTASKNNRFYLPHATGPAWQGDTTTVSLMAPLDQLVNFMKEDNTDGSRLEFTCCECPVLLRESLAELFPMRIGSQRNMPITMLTLSNEGDIEMGAAKFVLAARDISYRLLALGYWADFLNPFSGRPYIMPKDGPSLYKQDHRFRGLNMSLSLKNHCIIISAEENDRTRFSGTIYCTAPSNYNELVDLLVWNEHEEDD